MFIGSFGGGNALTPVGGGRVIWQPTPKTVTYTPTAPQQPTTRPAPVSTSPPINRMPVPTKALVDPVIQTPTLINDAAPAGPAPTSATGATTGAQTGSTGTSDTSRLFDLIAASFQPQSITPGLSPTSVVDTSTVQPTSGTTSPLALLVVGVAIAGGIFWYMKHRKTRAAA